jgi:hypothetical protein
VQWVRLTPCIQTCGSLAMSISPGGLARDC